LALADEVAAVPDHPERARALTVLAALLPSRGLWRRSGELYASLAADYEHRDGVLAVLGLVATGEIDGARAFAAGCNSAEGESFQSAVVDLTASGALASLGE